ncbi:cell envelope integrity protein CreD [Vulcaniibacterium tengchongense]|uniref:Inner membrane protein n=1 Tax=Vulcaniibacterium tengchongense TaxID=1273429 RepID=A0A3N4VMX4_9GAMM|nr:cell envelope integrity protein CreD [Vulcaniibacterium tengchongense]RPE81179.1 inner membrane protein [Vulcaniibacterium tengchongense]
MRLILKMGLVFAMTLAILIPLLLVRGVIHDRQRYRAEAVQEVAARYAGPQGLAGPVLVVPYTETAEAEETDASGVARKVRRERTRYWTFFPTRLDVAGRLRPDTRKRGLHQVRVFEWQGKVRASFEAPIPDEADAAPDRRIGRPWLSYALADVRGLRAAPQLRIDGRAVPVEEGVGGRDAPGLHVRLPAPARGQVLRLQTELDLPLGGTESLAVVPLGKDNRIALESTWPHPGFIGASPRQDLGDDGFRADWRIASLASNAQRGWLEREGRGLAADAAATLRAMDAVGVELIDPVDVYTQADRATKYGLLFVLLTFVSLFLFELIKQLPVHPIQYGLVGLALAIFFLLLVALSEHVAFPWAYLAASVACIGLIGFYLSAALRSVWRGLGFAAMLAVLYAALYGLLVSEDNALALGAGLLFLVLAVLMAVTRRVDWYQLAGARPPARA